MSPCSLPYGWGGGGGARRLPSVKPRKRLIRQLLFIAFLCLGAFPALTTTTDMPNPKCENCVSMAHGASSKIGMEPTCSYFVMQVAMVLGLLVIMAWIPKVSPYLYVLQSADLNPPPPPPE